jgi:hypothetical protein
MILNRTKEQAATQPKNTEKTDMSLVAEESWIPYIRPSYLAKCTETTVKTKKMPVTSEPMRNGHFISKAPISDIKLHHQKESFGKNSNRSFIVEVFHNHVRYIWIALTCTTGFPQASHVVSNVNSARNHAVPDMKGNSQRYFRWICMVRV